MASCTTASGAVPGLPRAATRVTSQSGTTAIWPCRMTGIWSSTTIEQGPYAGLALGLCLDDLCQKYIKFCFSQKSIPSGGLTSGDFSRGTILDAIVGVSGVRHTQACQGLCRI